MGTLGPWWGILAICMCVGGVRLLYWDRPLTNTLGVILFFLGLALGFIVVFPMFSPFMP